MKCYEYFSNNIKADRAQPRARARAHSPSPSPQPGWYFIFWGPDIGVETRFCDSTPMSAPKTRIFRFYTYVRSADKVENAFLQFYTYVRTQNSHFCDSTPMSGLSIKLNARFCDCTPLSGPKTRMFAMLHLCPDPKNSRVCDSTPLPGYKIRDFTILHFCAHMSAASAHLVATLTHMDFYDLARRSVLDKLHETNATRT